MLNHRILACVASALCVMPALAHAQVQAADQPAIYVCQHEAENTIRIPMPQSDTILFSANSRVTKSKKGTLVHGEGELQVRKGTGSRWQSFTFECVYDEDAGESANLKVSFDKGNWRAAKRDQEQAPVVGAFRPQGRS